MLSNFKKISFGFLHQQKNVQLVTWIWSETSRRFAMECVGGCNLGDQCLWRAGQWQRRDNRPPPIMVGCEKMRGNLQQGRPLINCRPPKNCKLMTNQIGSTNHSKVGYKNYKLSTTPENWWIWLVLPNIFWGRQSLQYPRRNFSPPKWIFTVFDMYEVLVHDQVFKCYILKTWESMITLGQVLNLQTNRLKST